MSSSPSSALRAVEQALAVLPSETPITAGVLVEKLGEAAQQQEDREYEEYMGEDL